jgi:hypothetical protein
MYLLLAGLLLLEKDEGGVKSQDVWKNALDYCTRSTHNLGYVLCRIVQDDRPFHTSGSMNTNTGANTGVA